MKNIAIFVSGNGKAAERIVKLFNEGNRLHTVLVVADDSAAEVLDNLKDEDTALLLIHDEQWNEKALEIAALLKEKEVKLLVLDNFDLVIPDEIMEATEGEMIRVNSPEIAPREVVAALEADLRKPAPEIPQQPEEESNPTPESEWADTLKINYTPPQVPTTPPEVPQSPQNDDNQDSQVFEGQPFDYKPQYPHYHNRRESEPQPPMPQTYLIWAILVTIFCCFIPGIIAIIFASMVSSKYYAGDFEGARRASRNTEIWIIVSVVLGVVGATLYIPFMFLNS